MRKGFREKNKLTRSDDSSMSRPVVAARERYMGSQRDEGRRNRRESGTHSMATEERTAREGQLASPLSWPIRKSILTTSNDMEDRVDERVGRSELWMEEETAVSGGVGIQSRSCSSIPSRDSRLHTERCFSRGSCTLKRRACIVGGSGEEKDSH